MEKSYLRELKASINSFTQNVFLKKHSIRHYGQKDDFLSEIAHPLLDRKVKLGPNFFHDYLSWD